MSLKLIAVLQEGRLRAQFLEVYGRAVTTRMLPSLRLDNEELLKIIEDEAAVREMFPTNGYSDEGFPTAFDGACDGPSSGIMWAEMEMGAIRHHLLGFGFVGLYHLFERQLATVLGILDS